MTDILKMLEGFAEDVTDCLSGIPCLKDIVNGINISLYNHTREALGLRPER